MRRGSDRNDDKWTTGRDTYRFFLGDTDTGTDYDHSTDYIGVFTGHGDSSYHGHGTVCRDKNTEEGGAVLHMGDPRDPTSCSAICCFLWPAKHRHTDRTISGGCTCLFH